MFAVDAGTPILEYDEIYRFVKPNIVSTSMDESQSDLISLRNLIRRVLRRRIIQDNKESLQGVCAVTKCDITVLNDGVEFYSTLHAKLEPET